MRLAKLAIGLCLGALPGCVVVDARQFTVYQYTTETQSTQTTSTTVEKDTPQPLRILRHHHTEVKKEQVPVQTGCSPFVIPTREAVPVQPDFSALGETKLEEAIASYIKKLRAVLKNERSVLDKAHRTHLSGCKG
jgi:hypothetical protein